MKQGYHKAKEMNDAKALDNAYNYRAMLFPQDIYPIIRYRTDRGEDYGVLVNKGEKVIVWNAFSEKLEQYHIPDYDKRFIAIVDLIKS